MVVVVIGGIDPTGRSGLAADLRTLVLGGVHGAPVVTALTVQDPTGVRKVVPTPVSDLVAAARAAIDSLPVRAIKVGLVAERAQAEALVSLIGDLPLVVDPVLHASAGGALSEGPGAYEPLLAHATLVTPNKDEAGVIFGSEAPEAWVARTRSAVLLKDGHGEGWEVVDWLLVPDAEARVWRHPRLSVRNRRGTGCTLASAIAAALALGHDLPSAVEVGLSTVVDLLRESDGVEIGPEPGPLLHHRWFRSR